MATLIGVVSQVVGEVFAVASDGSRRPISEGDRVYAGEQLVTGASGAVAVAMSNGQQLTLGRDSSITLDAQMLASGSETQPPSADTPPSTAPSDDDLSDVERLQAAIEAGVDPTLEGEATAAGPGAGAGGAGGAGGGNSFVMLSEVGGALDPVIGYPTGPLAAAPLFPEGEVFATADFSPELTVVFLDEQGSVVTGPGVVDEAALDGGENGGGQPGSNPGSNAERTSGSLIINSPDGIGRIEVLDASGNWVNVTGGGTVQGAYGVLVFDAAGNWTYTLTDNSLNHGNPNATGADDQLFDNFSVRVFDLDGDVSPSVPLTIAINDDGPSASLEFSREGGDVVLDESAGLQAGSNDVAGPLAVFDSVANASSDMRAYAQGTAPAVVASYEFGADEGGASAVYSLALVEDQASDLTTTSGSPITLTIENGLVVGRDADGNAAFAVAIDPGTGVISVAQYQSLRHPDGDDANDSIDLNGLIRAVLTVTDGDGDRAVASADIGQLIRFVDDGPTASIRTNEGVRVSHDESAGLQNGTVTPTPNGDANDNDTASGAVASLFSGVGNPGSDLSAAGYATSNGAVVDISGSSSGEDNEGATTVLSLSIVDGNGSDSGLTTTDGQTIRLYLENGLIVGRVDGGEAGPGAAAFAIAIGQDGSVSVAQYVSLYHPDTGSPDDAVTLAGKVRAVVTVTDGDGDVDSAQVGIGDAIRFEDDGPSAVIERLEGVRVTHDESAGLQNATETPAPQGDALDDDTSNPDVIALFAGVSNVGTDLAGYATSAGPVVSTAGSSSGEDNEGATTVLSLAINGGDGTDSGLTTTDGQSIRLYLENGLIVGRVEGGDSGRGSAVFAVAIGQDGTISVAQYMSLNHPDTSSRDEGVDLGGLVRAVVTVTDGDGDVDVASVNIGGAIRFEDDAPTANIQVVEGARVTHDETPGLQNGSATPSPGNDANDNDSNSPSVIALFSSVANAGTVLAAGYASSDGPVVDASGSTTGEDQEGATTVLSLAVQDADSGLSALDGSPIRLSEEGGLIVGRVEGGIYDGKAAFAVAIGTDGSLSVAQYLPLRHPDNASHDEALNLSGKIRAVVTVTDGDGDVSVDSVGIGGAVRFEDDGPTASNVIASKVLDDEGLKGGINGGPGDVNDANTSTSGTLGYYSGADGLQSIELTGPSMLGTENVTSTWDTTSKTLTIGSAARGELVTVVLTDLASGAYTVNLLKPLMHPTSGIEDNVTLNIGYKITDGDGDTADGTLKIIVNDDTPTIQAMQPGFESQATFLGTDAGFSNSYGYYTRDADGDPVAGKVIWANVKTVAVGTEFDLGDLDPTDMGFFIIPNGGANAGLSDEAELTFEQDANGNWQAVLNGTPLTGAGGAAVLFDRAELNPRGSALQDNDEPGNQNWEDVASSPDYDYNDVSTNVSWGMPLQVDETDLGTPAGAVATRDFSSAFNAEYGADGAGWLRYDLAIKATDSGLVDTTSGEKVKLSFNAQGVLEGRTETGNQLVFTLAVDQAGVATLTQLRAVVHPSSQPDELNLLGAGKVELKATITDADGDQATARIDLGQVIGFRDDAPTAVDDIAALLVEGSATNVVQGNVLDNDLAGNDGGKAFKQWNDSPSNAAAIAELGKYGSLLLDPATGAYSFTLDNDDADTLALAEGQTVSQRLQYTIRDADGDVSSAYLTIRIVGSNNGVSLGNLDVSGGELIVDEQHLASGSAPDSDALTHSGTFTIEAPGGIASLQVGDAPAFTFDQLQGASASSPLLIESAAGVLKITGFDDTSGADTVRYEYTLENAVAHPGEQGRNTVTDQFGIVVTDRNGDSATGTLDVTIIDDVPVAKDNKVCIEVNGLPPYNLTLVLDSSGSMDEKVNADLNGDGTNENVTRLDVAKAALVNLIDSYLALGVSLNFKVIDFDNGGRLVYEGTDAAAAKTAINAMEEGGNTNYASALNLARSELESDLSNPALADYENRLYFLSDGEPYPSNNGAPAGWKVFVDSNDIDVVTVGIQIPVNGSAAAELGKVGNAGDSVIVVSDPNDLSATLGETVPDAVEGNVISDSDSSGVDVPGADGVLNVISVSYLAADGVLRTAAVPTGGTTGPLETFRGGKLVMASDGNYSYVAPKGVADDSEDVFTYTVRDADGDTSSANLILCTKDGVPVAKDNEASVPESGLPPYNLTFVLDSSGSMGDVVSADLDGDGDKENATRLDVAKAALINLIDSYIALGVPLNLKVIDFDSGSGLVYEGTDAAEAKIAINAMGEGGNTNYSSALSLARAQLEEDLSNPGLADYENRLYFLSDGEPYPSGNGVPAGWQNFVDSNDIDVIAVGIQVPYSGSAVNELRKVGNTGDAVIVVQDPNELSATLADTVPASLEGNVITDAGPDGVDDPGADGPVKVISITYIDAQGNEVTAAVLEGGSSGPLTTELGGTLVISSDGSYTYSAPRSAPVGAQEVFTYTIADRDGDTSNAKLTINILDGAPIAVDERAVAQEGYWKVDGNVTYSAEYVAPGHAIDIGISDVSNAPNQGQRSSASEMFSVTARDGAPATVTFSVRTSDWNSEDRWQAELFKVGQAMAVDSIFDQDAGRQDVSFDSINESGDYYVKFTVFDKSGSSWNPFNDRADLRIDKLQYTNNLQSINVTVPGVAWVVALLASGNVLGGDNPGPNGGLKVTHVDGHAIPVDGLTLQGQHGSLHIASDGAYTYTPNATDLPLGSSEQFAYKIVDADGSTGSAVLKIDIKDWSYSERATNGNDMIGGNDVGNTLSGLRGNDVIYGGAGSDTLSGGDGNDHLLGGDGDDALYGDSGNDVLNGGAGNDRLEGGAGNDILLGGLGDDILIGGPGNDILIGGAGDDTFVWNAGDRGGNYHDIVKDFGNGNDRLDLSELLTGVGPNADGDALSHYLSFDFAIDPGSTVIAVSSAGNGNVDQTITLENTIVGGGMGNAADIIDNMLDNNQLVV
ncbi:retention module-containing protein [Pseudomonas sp. Marseille-Q0931]|uniref:retention module-containing protein n=1 Tax=Pseudomonas sp. Marseille-Q0931 TaxID=2697507 RepID=UPI0023BA2249|nr:retention module-containing protein [Pseudomonas sp. Marseille-Q0931]